MPPIYETTAGIAENGHLQTELKDFDFVKGMNFFGKAHSATQIRSEEVQEKYAIHD